MVFNTFDQSNIHAQEFFQLLSPLWYKGLDFCAIAKVSNTTIFQSDRIFVIDLEWSREKLLQFLSYEIQFIVQVARKEKYTLWFVICELKTKYEWFVTTTSHTINLGEGFGSCSVVFIH